MKLITIQEALTRKFERQKRVPMLELHASGHCAHLGPISPGCRSCFEPDPFRRNILCGVRCNLHCDYCSEKREKEPDQDSIIRSKARIYRDSHAAGFAPTAVSFSGGGEPLLYLDVIGEYMAIFRAAAPRLKARPWYYLYTNGILADSEVLGRLKEWGFDEIRFHLGASDFSRNVWRNMEKAARCFKAVTVETPAWPPHRKKLFETLSVLAEIGVKHLNLGEVEINKHNIKKISALLPDAEIYAYHEMYLDDGGLVYDVMEEVAAKKYSYSVLDCSCFVKSMQRGPAKEIRREDLRGLCDSTPSIISEAGRTQSKIRPMAKKKIGGFRRKSSEVESRAKPGPLLKLTMTSVFAPADKVFLQNIEGVSILMSASPGISDDEFLKLNETGRAVWQALDGKRTCKRSSASTVGRHGGRGLFGRPARLSQGRPGLSPDAARPRSKPSLCPRQRRGPGKAASLPARRCEPAGPDRLDPRGEPPHRRGPRGAGPGRGRSGAA